MMLWLLIAIALDTVMLWRTGPSYHGLYQAGYGSIDHVNRRQADPFVANRVLVPWIIAIAEWLFPSLRKHRLPALYEPIRIIGWTLALTVIERAIGTPGALLVAAFMPATFLFDFWDTPWEILAFACALSGDMRLTIASAGLLGFARPWTALAVGPIYGFVTGDWLGAGLAIIAAGLAMLAVRIWVGKLPPSKSTGWCWRQNLDEVIHIFRNRPFYLSETAMSLGLTALVIWVVLSGRAGPSWPIPLALVGFNWVYPRASETRGICSSLLWVAGGLLR